MSPFAAILACLLPKPVPVPALPSWPNRILTPEDIGSLTQCHRKSDGKPWTMYQLRILVTWCALAASAQRVDYDGLRWALGRSQQSGSPAPDLDHRAADDEVHYLFGADLLAILAALGTDA